MHVLIVSQHFWPEEFRVNDLVAELKKREIEVTVLTGLPNYPHGVIPESFRRDPQAYSVYKGAQVVRVPLLPRGRAGGGRLVLNYLTFAISASTLGLYKLRRQRFDATIVFMSSPPIQALPALLLRILAGTPALMWVQDLWPQTLSAVGAIRSRALVSVVGAFVGLLYRSAWGVLIQSEAFRQDVEARAGRRAQVLHLPNWAEPNIARGLDGVSVAPELDPFVGCFKVMFAGNLGEAQDLPSVVRAADFCRELVHVRWLIVGDGRARAKAEALVAEMNLQDRVIFLGRFPSNRMPEFFKGADAMLVSLRKEPIFSMTVPSKVQSYLAAGRPIVGMLDGEGSRIIHESCGGLTAQAGDAEGLARAVRSLAAMSPEARATMARQGRDYARAQFDKDLLIDRLAGWIQAAAASSRG